MKQTANEERQKKWYDTMTALVLGLHVTSQPADDITKEDKDLVNQLEDMYESMKAKLLMQVPLLKCCLLLRVMHLLITHFLTFSPPIQIVFGFFHIILAQ